MTNRRGFFASLAALVVAPAVPVKRPDPLLAEIAELSRRAEAMLAFMRSLNCRPVLDPDEMIAYRHHVTAELRRLPRVH